MFTLMMMAIDFAWLAPAVGIGPRTPRRGPARPDDRDRRLLRDGIFRERRF